MSLRLRVPACSILSCDACGGVFKDAEYEEPIHFDGPDDDNLKVWLVESEWITSGDKHFCRSEECPALCRCGHYLWRHSKDECGDCECEAAMA